MEVLKASYDEKMKTAFNRIEAIEIAQKEYMKETNKEIERLKAEILGLKGVFKEELNEAVSSIKEDIQAITTSSERKENERLREQNEKYFKWFFWLITAVLGTIVTIFITSYLNSR